MGAALSHLRRRGYSPDCIIDIGAYVADWSRLANQYFPGRPMLLVDGNPSHRAVLEAGASELGVQARSTIALLGAQSGQTVKFFEIGSGSSILEELTNLYKTVYERSLERLDDVTETFLADTETTPESILMKIDVQGYELEVLRGGLGTLPRVSALILELSLLQYNRGAPLLDKVVNWLAEAGFLAYDICGFHRRETDDALFQIDMVFVPAGSVLRTGSFWAVETNS